MSFAFEKIMLRQVVVASRGGGGGGGRNAARDNVRSPGTAISKRRRPAPARFVYAAAASRGKTMASPALASLPSTMWRNNSDAAKIGISPAAASSMTWTSSFDAAKIGISPGTTSPSPSTGPFASGFTVGAEYYGYSSPTEMRRFHSSPRISDVSGEEATAPRRKPLSRRGRRNRKSREKKRQSKRNAEQPEAAPFRHRTHGPTGRPIMTEGRLDEMLSTANGHLPAGRHALLSRETSDQAKSLLHNAQKKLPFRQKYEHSAEGGGGGQGGLFFATLRSKKQV